MNIKDLIQNSKENVLVHHNTFFLESKLGRWEVHCQTGLIVSRPAGIESSNVPLLFDTLGYLDKKGLSFITENVEAGVTLNILEFGLWYRDKDGYIQYEEPAYKE